MDHVLISDIHFLLSMWYIDIKNSISVDQHYFLLSKWNSDICYKKYELILISRIGVFYLRNIRQTPSKMLKWRPYIYFPILIRKSHPFAKLGLTKLIYDIIINWTESTPSRCKQILKILATHCTTINCETHTF